MYTVSNDYLTKMFDQVQTHKLTGTIDNVEFSSEDVIGVSYSNQCADNNVVVGSVYVGTLKLTFLKDILERGDYYDKEIKIYDHLLVAEDTWEPVLIGTFYVGEAQWSGTGMIDITAYDVLSKLDKTVTFDQSSAELYGWLNVIATECDVTVGMTEADCEALPNGNIALAVYDENNITTYRDLLSKLAQTAGGFGYATRDGGIAIKNFNNNSILSIPKINRFTGATYSDYETRFDAISFNDLINETVWIEGDPEGYIMELGDEPFLQYGSDEERKAHVQALFNSIKLMTYTPFKVEMLPAFVILDLGDVVSFTSDYSGNTSTGCIMNVSWQYNKSFVIQCFGANPNLKNAKSKTDNAVTGASRYGGNSKLATFVATNADPVVIGYDEPMEVVRAHFSVADNAAALALFECKFNLPEKEIQDESGYPIPYSEILDVYYYLDGALLDYRPQQTYGEPGVHTISLMLPIVGASADAKHTLIVYLKTIDSETPVAPLDAHLYIQSTGTAGAAKWDGWISAKDDYKIVDIGDLGFVDFNDSVTINLFNNVTIPETVGDNISLCGIGYYEPLNLVDTCNVYLEGSFAFLLEQNNEVLRTESDVRIITE